MNSQQKQVIFCSLRFSKYSCMYCKSEEGHRMHRDFNMAGISSKQPTLFKCYTLCSLMQTLTRNTLHKGHIYVGNKNTSLTDGITN